MTSQAIWNNVIRGYGIKRDQGFKGNVKLSYKSVFDLAIVKLLKYIPTKLYQNQLWVP